MTANKCRKLLWTSATMMLACGAACVIAAVVLPYNARRTSALIAGARAGSSVRTDEGVPTMEAFARVWDKPLRAPLVDPPPATQPSPASVALSAAPPASPVQLAGTVVERGHNYALLTMPDGHVELKGVGENANGADVDSVTERSVTLHIGGQSITLELPRPE